MTFLESRDVLIEISLDQLGLVTGIFTFPDMHTKPAIFNWEMFPKM